MIALFTAIKGAGSGPSRLPARQQRFTRRAGWQRLLPVLDGAMIDLKGWRDSVHHTLTGYGRERVLASLQLLAQAGKLAEVRLLQVPGQSDYLAADGTLEGGLAAFLHSPRARAHTPQRLSPSRRARRGAGLARGGARGAGAAGCCAGGGRARPRHSAATALSSRVLIN